MRKLTLVATLLALTGTASAQLTQIGPFTGTLSEGFEACTTGQFTACIIPDIFGGNATLCTPLANSSHVTGAWFGSACGIYPHSGTWLAGNSGSSHWELTFDPGYEASRFGGYMGGNRSDASHGTIAFYDAGNNLIGTDVINAPNDCQWYWNGWSSTTPIKRIEMTGNNSLMRVLLDDLTADPGGGCPPPVVYCTAGQGTSSSGCFASISTSNMAACPTAGADDYDVIVSKAETGKPGIIFYGYATASIPFSSGTLCVQPPLKRTPPQNTGGTTPCTGQMTLRINDPLGVNHTGGTVVYYQGWNRDPASGVGTDVSDAVEVTYQ